MSLLVVEVALQAKVRTLGYTVMPENVPFDQDSQPTPFIEVYSLPNTNDELSKTGRAEYLGIYQLSIYTDPNKGRGEALGIIGAINSAFYAGSEINTGETKIIIDSVSMSQGINDGNHYRNNVSINYRVFTGI